MKKHRIALLLAVAAISLAGEARAQVFTPTFLAPRSSSDIGVYLSDGPGEFTVEGIWRRGFGGYDLGFRGGLVDAEDALITLGAELRNPLVVGTPVDLAVTGGVQGIIGDVDAVGLQAGLSIGHTFALDAPFSLTPYVHPRIGFIDSLGGDGDDFDLDVLADLGLDFEFSPNLSLRLGLGIGDEQADLGVGLAWR